MFIILHIVLYLQVILQTCDKNLKLNDKATYQVRTIKIKPQTRNYQYARENKLVIKNNWEISNILGN